MAQMKVKSIRKVSRHNARTQVAALDAASWLVVEDDDYHVRDLMHGRRYDVGNGALAFVKSAGFKRWR